MKLREIPFIKSFFENLDEIGFPGNRGPAHDVKINSLIALHEHQFYRQIPGTANSFREDPQNTNTLTLRHAHVYAKLNGRGQELYAVNIDGSGHDGSSGTVIPASHADFFRSKGYLIGDDNVLESLTIDQLKQQAAELLIFP